MEIKHTYEILAKDIQDIEKLVRNIQNSPEPVAIDLDLALSKLRNVYEVLLMIKEDNFSRQAMRSPSLTAEDKVADTPGLQNYDKIKSASPSAEMGSSEAEKVIPVFEETGIVFEETAGEEKMPGIEDTDKKIMDKGKEVEKVVRQIKPGEPSKPKREAEILAEKFNKESSLNENLGLKRAGDVTSKLSSQPIDSISRNIGINDRFFIIKELFKGDSEGYNNIIRNLDQSNNFNEAFSIIEKRFPDTIEHDGVQILVNLARRRFISSGNV